MAGYIGSNTKFLIDAVSKDQLLTEIQNVDGEGSGLDTDLIRGLPADEYVGEAVSNDLSQTDAAVIDNMNRYLTLKDDVNNELDKKLNTSELLDKIKVVDGAGCGLDADKLDGLDSTAFAKIDGDSNQTFKVADAVTTDEAVNLNQLINYTNLTYVQYSTNDAYMSIPQPSAYTWFDLPEVNITIPEDGTYLVIPAIRMWQGRSTGLFWKKHRLLKNGVQIGSNFFGFNKMNVDLYDDSTHSFVYIFNLQAGDVIQVQGYWCSNTYYSTYYSDANGSTSIVAVRIGE